MKITVTGSEAEGKVKYAIDGNGEYNKTQLGCVAVELGLKHLIENKGMSLQQAVEFINDIKPEGKWKIVTDEAGVFAEGRHKVVEFTTSKGNHTVYVNNQWTPLRSDNFIIGFNERFADGAAVAAPAANADAEKAKAEAAAAAKASEELAKAKAEVERLKAEAEMAKAEAAALAKAKAEIEAAKAEAEKAKAAADKAKSEADKAKANASASLGNIEYVDLDLPSGLKWAKMNLGATKPEEAGWHIAWGELRPKADYSEASSLTVNKDSYELESEGIIDDKGNLTAAHDVASKVCGGKWRMPTKDDFKELMTYCTWEWTTLNSVKGYKVKSTMPGNDNWIFLPAAGYRCGTSSEEVGSYGRYWSSTVSESYSSNAFCLIFDSSIEKTDGYYRYYGRTVRPVSE